MSGYRSTVERIRDALSEIERALEDEMDAADSMDTSPHGWWYPAEKLTKELRAVMSEARP